MKFDKSLVSIIVRTKDRPALLQEALKSIIAQTYKPLEVIVVNDGGCDITDIIMHFNQKVNQKDITIKYLVQKHNIGRPAAGNIGLEAATGDYLIFLDDDDWFDPQHISILVHALHNDTRYLVAYAGVCVRNSPDEPELHIFNSPFDPIQLMLGNTIPIHALMFKRTLLDNGCKMDEQLDRYEDWDLWLQFSCHTDFLHIKQISAFYRPGGNSNAGLGADARKVIKFRQKLIAKWKFIWDAEKLDNAMQFRVKQLKACQMQLNELMEAHKILQQEHDKSLVLINKYQKQEEKFLKLHSSYREIINSRLWRYTKPIRIITSVLRKLKF